MSKTCQSCGMPLRRDEHGGGTNADGSKSTTYCSHCYQAGRFVMPDLTVQQMRERVKVKLAGAGVPRPLAALLTRRIPKLRRWKSPE